LIVRSLLLGIVLAASLAAGALGHESRPAYLAITETTPHRYDVLWRTPLLSGMRLPVVLRLPDDMRNLAEPDVRELPDSLVERRLIDSESGMPGKRIEFVGLQATITDVLVRVELLDGTRLTTLVRPSRPWVEIAASGGPLAIAGAYFMHGVEHILFGFDHLLFVLALVILVGEWRRVVVTVTAFTVAHSITLAAATLGFVSVPSRPVEAMIALSILLVAVEIVRARRGEPSLTARWPWLVAFAFGLLHGFGFAGALAEVGLPPHAIPLALLFFNLGVEVGQLAFVALVMALAWWLPRAIAHLTPADQGRARLEVAATYVIGTLAAYWLIERIVGFWA
jgi:hydrogenase/urease accessory protein HupE